MRIDLKLESEYYPILQRLQENDDSMIQFTKNSLEKYSRYVEGIGLDFTKQSTEELNEAIEQINPETDLKAFIMNNRRGTPQLQREDIHHPPDIIVNGKIIKFESFNSLKSTLTGNASGAASAKFRKTSEGEAEGLEGGSLIFASIRSKKPAGPIKVEKALKNAFGATDPDQLS
jgi:hypothetical protein